jgi:phage portal protein BeeE
MAPPSGPYGVWPTPPADAAAARRARRRQQAGPLLAGLRVDPPGYPTDNRYEQSSHFKSVVYLAIKALMDAVGGATVQVVRRRRKALRPKGVVRKGLPAPGSQGRDQDWLPVRYDHEAQALLDHPNAHDTTADLLAQVVLQYHLTGSALVWMVPNRLGLPCELYVLPTALCTYQPISPDYPAGAWRVSTAYQTGGMPLYPAAGSAAGTVIDAREVARLKHPHPLYRWDAWSPLTAGAAQIDLVEKIDRSCWAAMDRGIRPDAVLDVGGMDEDQIARLREDIRRKHSGPDNAGGVFVIGTAGSEPGAGAKLLPMHTSPKDMDYASGWDRYSAFVLALFGVPKAVVNLSGASSYSELFAALKQFHTLTLRPLTARLAAALTAGPVRAWDERARCQIDLPTLDDPDLLEKQITADSGSGAITVNEIRALRNREPVPGGDVPPDVYKQVLSQKLQPQQEMGQGPAMNPAGDEPPAGSSPGSPPAVPKPDNKAAEGSLPLQIGKALSAYDAAAGGSLVPAAAGRRRKKLTRRKLDRACKAILDRLDAEPVRWLKGGDWDESKHKRAGDGKFGSGGGSGGGGDHAPAAGKPRSRVGRAAAAVGPAAGQAEHALKDLVVAAHDRLPAGLRGITGAAFRLGMIGFDAGQAAASAAAAGRGLSPDRVDRIGHLLAVADVAFFKGAKAAALLHIPGGHAAFAVAGTLPVASLAYLAYSASRNPIRTIKAARKAVKEAVAKTAGKVVGDVRSIPKDAAGAARAVGRLAGVSKAMGGSGGGDNLGRLMAALADADDARADWLTALFAAALAEARGDRERAAGLALDAADEG